MNNLRDKNQELLWRVTGGIISNILKSMHSFKLLKELDDSLVWLNRQ